MHANKQQKCARYISRSEKR